ncbi:uncharacterized protein LOC113775523 isoform X3 [Coffea eugenioides]|uniref:uncharacterized protein LOC113775523 isoform X3 n=1 Tax=Coffea eugenioides TaxID=49369 RepID=UPI000F612AEF|nr:uncharacterized protein LOC113775523 isoform X3 [Coffea eugenioides]
MLIQSLIAGTVEGAISFVSCFGTQDFSCNQYPGVETWQDYTQCEQHPHDKFTNLLSSSDGSCSLGTPNAHLQITSCATMTGSSVPMCVYKRKKQQITSSAICPVQISVSTKPGGRSNSSISSHAPSGSTKEHTLSVEAETEVTGSPCKPSVKCNTDGIVSKSASFNGCLVGGEEPSSEEALRSDSRRILDVCRIDDSCSSSKLNLGIATASHQTDVDDTGECSSSGVSILERSWDNMSGKDFCISILRSQGLLQRVSAQQHHAPADDSCANCCSRKCKVCNNSETTLNMLICDNCEDAFHASCCYPRIKKIPIDEWFCYSCLKKKRKLLMEKSTSNSLNIDNGSGQCRNATSEGELGPIESMLKDMEPCKFPVRIGREFQAEIPDRPHPIIDEVDPTSEPEEMIQSEYLYLHVIEGIGEHVDGTICGKWRRAPLFEVQTDDWECFRAVLWDPSHADCAVPQEIPTDQVLRQLKYIEKLYSCKSVEAAPDCKKAEVGSEEVHKFQNKNEADPLLGTTHILYNLQLSRFAKLALG